MIMFNIIKAFINENIYIQNVHDYVSNILEYQDTNIISNDLIIDICGL